MKCVQVEDHVCLTGSEDGTVRIWDLRRVDGSENNVSGGEDEGEMVSRNEVTEDGMIVKDIKPNSVRIGADDSCARLLEGHTKAVTALYFEDDCLVRYFPPCRQRMRVECRSSIR